MAVTDYIPFLRKDHCKLEDLELEVVLNHRVGYSKNVPIKKVESGFQVADHVEHKPTKISIRVTTNRRSWREDKQHLIDLANGGKPMLYYSSIDKNNYQNVLIANLDFVSSKDQIGGFTADLTLQVVTITTAVTGELTVVPNEKDQIVQGDNNQTPELKTTLEDGVFGRFMDFGKESWYKNLGPLKFFN